MTAVLFDLDGTLLDTLQDLTDAVHYTLAQFGCPPRTVKEVRAFIGSGARQLIALSLPGKADDPDVDRVLEVYQAYYKAHCRIKTGPYPGIPEALEKIRQLCPVAIVSNKPDGAVKALCAAYFPGIYALGETPDCPRKPAPDMVHRAMGALGAERCIYVGDSDVDIVTAGNAGAACISVSWGFRDADVLEAAGATHLCRRTQDLPELVQRLLEQQ